MKALVFTLALIFSVTLCAQDNKPTFEKDGSLVKATYYHDNGKIAQEGYFLNDKLHDKWKMFDEKGETIAMGSYHMGKRTGKWYFWNKEGVKEVDYLNNKVVNVVNHSSAESIVVY